MKPGKPSETAARVCMGRALAHARLHDQGSPDGFSDPTALPLLSDAHQAIVNNAVEKTPTRSIREKIERGVLEHLSRMMIARTIEIDEAVRAVRHPQLVILGAGLDGRAWRMPELADTLVFEVDHPDTQNDKKLRLASLHLTAREIRLVPMDFTRDSLDSALAAAGHDPSVPTTWIWEGVVMYLTREDIEKSLAVIQGRSAKDTRVRNPPYPHHPRFSHHVFRRPVAS